MREKSRTGAAKTQHSEEFIGATVSWDDLRIFAKCADKGSFRAAGRELKLDSATVVRRIDRLERLLEQRLFIRWAEGVMLTEEGKRIIAEVRTMERASFNLARLTRIDARSLNGVVRIAITEGLGTYWVLPRLLDFQKAHTRLTIELQGTMNTSDIGKLEADIAVQFSSPERPDLIAARLGYMHIYPFASPDYAKQFGLPAHKSEIQNHRIVQQVAPMLDETAYARELGLESVEGIVGVRTNASSSVLYAIERGAGIGFLPTYVLAIGAKLVPVDMNVRYRIEIWLAYHPDLRQSRRHVAVIDWLRRIFEASRFPCFAEEFIHPTSVAKALAFDTTTDYATVNPFEMQWRDASARDKPTAPLKTSKV